MKRRGVYGGATVDAMPVAGSPLRIGRSHRWREPNFRQVALFDPGHRIRRASPSTGKASTGPSQR